MTLMYMICQAKDYLYNQHKKKNTLNKEQIKLLTTLIMFNGNSMTRKKQSIIVMNKLKKYAEYIKIDVLKMDTPNMKQE